VNLRAPTAANAVMIQALPQQTAFITHTRHHLRACPEYYHHNK